MRPFKPRATDLAALAAAALLIIATFADILFRNRALYIRDVSRFFYPNFAILRELIRSGAFPFWNFRYNAGQPFAANPAFASLYPPQWLAAFSDHAFGYQVQIVAHYLLAAVGMYVFLRSIRLRPPSALFGAISFALGGMLLSLSNLVNVLFGVAWLPWLAFAARRRNFALAALFLGAILLIGDQAVILQAGFLLAAWAVQLAWRSRSARPLVFAACVVLAALAVGGGQIIPALDHQRDSGRAGAIPYSMVAQWTLPPARPLELALPTVFGAFKDWPFYWAGKRFYGSMDVPWVFSFYNGMLVFVLASAGFVRRVRGWTLTASVAAVSYAAAVFPLLYFAGLRSVRYPEKFFIAGVFMLIVFAAITADRLLEDEKLRRTATGVAFLVVIAAIGSLIWVSSPQFATTWRLTGYFGDYLMYAREGAVITIATALALTLILGARRFLSPRIWIALLALFVLADLMPRTRGLTPRIDASYYEPPPAAEGLRGARVYNDADWRMTLLGAPPMPVEQRAWRVRNGLLPEMQAIWGIDAVLEIDITLTNLLPSIEFSHVFWAAQFARRTDVVPILLSMAGATHVVELRDGTSADRPTRIVALPSNQRFYFADQIIAGPLSQILTRRVSPHTVFADESFAPIVGRVIRSEVRPNAIDLDVETTGQALLVIAVTRHKYWKGILDGMPARIRPANEAFQSMVIPPGRHHVALRYRNPVVMIFGLISAVSVLALAAVAALRSRAPQPPTPH